MKTSIPKLHSIQWKHLKNIEAHPSSERINAQPMNVFAGAINAKLKDIVIIGTSPDGSLYVASTHLRTAEAFLQLERGKNFLMVNS